MEEKIRVRNEWREKNTKEGRENVFYSLLY